MQKISIFFFGWFLHLFILVSALNAQESPVVVNRSTTVQNVDGKQYFFHAVMQGQTLYSIAKAYGVNVNDILRENPDLRNQELKYNQIIRIPVKNEVQTGDQPKSTTLTEVTFIDYQVKRRETLYGIAKMFNITENDILTHNPQARSGLKNNMILRIPRLREVTAYYKDYVVLPRQTLFSISREFGVSIAELENLNPELKDGLKAGQILKIPVHHTPAVQPPFVQEQPENKPSDNETGRLAVITDPYCNNPQTKSHYNVALMIPLYLENLGDEGFISPEAMEQSFSFMEYYEGIMIALDSIRAGGADIRLTVYDVDNDESKARAAIWKPDLANMDLIIGPFFPNVLTIVADFAKDKKIPVVSPLHSNDREFLSKYPYLFQATPDLITQLKDMGDYIVENYPEDNIIIVHNNQSGVINLVASYKQSLNDGLNTYMYRRDSSHMAKLDGYFLNGVYVGERISNVYVINDSLRQLQNETGDITSVDPQQYAGRNNVQEIIYSRDGMNQLKNSLEKDKRNIVVTLMGGEADISNYTRQLSQLRDTFDITVFGVPNWREFRSIDLDYLHQLNTHIFSTDYIDYERINNLDFIRRYSKINGVEPGPMGFKAVETGMFFFSVLSQYGPQFYRCMEQINQNKSIHTPYVFERVGEDGGWENQHVHIFRYEDYTLKDVKESKRRMVIHGR